MNRIVCGCAVLAALLVSGWSRPAEAHWRGVGISIGFGAPVYYGYSYRSYGWGAYPGYYGGYYGAYPTHVGYGPVYGGYPVYGYPVSYGYAAPIYYGGYYGCGW